MEPKFVILIELLTGEIVKAFTWTRDRESGLLRARSEVAESGYNIANIQVKKI